MKPERILVFDAEIFRAIATKPDERERYDEMGIQYVTDWNAFSEMGIACLCAPTLAECLNAKDGAALYREAMFFTGQTIGNIEYYFNQFDFFVSYNGVSFDWKLLNANGCYPDPEKHYDLANEVKRLTRKLRPPKMDDLAGANNLPRKTGSGAMAPVMWQQGKQREVIEYCFSDCIVLAHLFQRVLERGSLQNPYTGQLIQLPSPLQGRRLF